MDKPLVRVGVGVIALNDKGQFLLGKRNNQHGIGTWAIIGGHLEHGEDFESCAAREVQEETGLGLKHIEVVSVANHIFDTGKHYISIYLIGQIDGPLASIKMDEREFAEWGFYEDWHGIPAPHFVDYPKAVKADLIDAYRRKHGLAA
ncbi:MAG TPA: NUDIX domain-containing protein [Alphaproteobacteria bacterium]